MKQCKTKFPYLVAATAACLLLCCVLLVGRVQAHYESRKDFSVLPSASATAHLYLQPLSSESESSGDWQGKKFVLSNFSDEDKNTAEQPALSAYVTVLATAGIEDPDSMEMVLELDGVSYTGQAEPVRENTELYRAFGPGWCYTFSDAEGAEPVFSFPAREQTEIQFEITAHTDQRIDFDSVLRVRAIGQMKLGEE